jgi:chromosome segregation protein
MRQILVLWLSILGAALAAQAQASSAENTTLSALRDEVHELRLAIERSTILGVKTQIAVQRIQAEEARVAQAATALGQARQELARYQAGRAQAALEQKSLEDRLSELTNPEQRREFEAHIRDSKRRLEDESEEARIRAREGELTSQLEREQSFLAQLQAEMSQVVGALNQAIQRIEAQRKQ